MGGSTKCFSMENVGSFLPRRGRDWWVGTPGANWLSTGAKGRTIIDPFGNFVLGGAVGGRNKRSTDSLRRVQRRGEVAA